MGDGRPKRLNHRYLQHTIAFLGLWYKNDPRTRKIIPPHPGGDNMIAYVVQSALTDTTLDERLQEDFSKFTQDPSGLRWLPYAEIIGHAMRFEDLITLIDGPEQGYQISSTASRLVGRIHGAQERYGTFMQRVVSEFLAVREKKSL